MTILAAHPLRLFPAPPALCSEGIADGRRAVDVLDRPVLAPAARTAVHGRWGSGQYFAITDIALPEREVSRRNATATPGPADPDHFLPAPPMRPTRKLDVLIPVADNDGHPFSPEDFAALEGLLLSLAGGYTNHGKLTGAWRSPSGQVFTDETRAYSVTVPADVAESVASAISRFVTGHFRQEATWIEFTPTFLAAV